MNYIAHGIKRASRPSRPSPRDRPREEAARASAAEKASPLEQYTQNLNQAAKDGKIDPLIGRDYEVERTIQIPCRRRKNNPLLVGETGVGKRPLRGPGLAHHRGTVPEVLPRPSSIRWTWARCWRAPSTVATSSSA